VLLIPLLLVLAVQGHLAHKELLVLTLYLARLHLQVVVLAAINHHLAQIFMFRVWLAVQAAVVVLMAQ
jgi:hypothetical protein